MSGRKFILFMITMLMQHLSMADSYLQDPVTNKVVLYYDKSEKVNLPDLNSFEDVEFILPVLKNNQRCTDSIHNWIMRQLRSPGYKQRLKENAMRAITNYIDYSDEVRDLSTYDRKMLIDQHFVLEDVNVMLQACYNGLLFIRIEAGYTINQSYGNMKEHEEMVQAIYVDVNTGMVRNIADLCPPNLKAKFSGYLSNRLNKTIALVNNSPEARKKHVSEEEEADEEDSGTPPVAAKPIPTHDKINFSDLIFDVNAMNFVVRENSINTMHTGGAPFVIYVSEDSLHSYLPWTINAQKRKLDERLKPGDVNKKLFIFRDEYLNIFNDEFLAVYFKSKLDAKEVTVYYRQKDIGDTTFKLHMLLKFNPDHTIDELRNSFELKDEKGILQKYYYRDGMLEKIEKTDREGKATNSALYAYNKNGFVTNYMDYSDEYYHHEHTFFYDGLSVNDCELSKDGNRCYTTVFDSAGDFISRTETGAKAVYKNTYRNNLLMAGAEDMLYSYTADGRIESIERDRGRYYTRYYYDEKGRISSVVQYDGKEVFLKTEVKYDLNDRIVLVSKDQYSYGKKQTQLEFQLLYN